MSPVTRFQRRIPPGPTRTSSRRARRRDATAALTRLGVAPSRLPVRDALREASLNVARAPLRTVLTSMGTVLAVGTAIATIGLADSASGAVSDAFNQLRATTVTFTDNNPQQEPPALTEAGEKSLDRLHGVVSSGLLWNLGNNGQLFTVSRISQPDPTGQATASLPMTAASPGALATAGAITSTGRLYDEGMDHRHDLVALLGSAAASQLGISSVALSPAIYVGGVRLTVIGIVHSTTLASEVLLGVIIPPGAVQAIPGQGSTETRQIIVQTAPGAAQLIGRQGPYALDPYQPSRISAAVPIDPSHLRNQVSGPVTSLLLAVAIVALVVGVIAITNTTLLSVIQRRPEIGLRRSVGAAPRHIAVLIVSEAALIGVIGGLIGTSTGVLITATVSASKGWEPVLDPALILSAPLVSTIAGLIAGLYPAWRASRVSPITALER